MVVTGLILLRYVKNIEEGMPPEEMAVMGMLLLKLWNGRLEY